MRAVSSRSGSGLGSTPTGRPHGKMSAPAARGCHEPTAESCPGSWLRLTAAGQERGTQVFRVRLRVRPGGEAEPSATRVTPAGQPSPNPTAHLAGVGD